MYTENIDYRRRGIRLRELGFNSYKDYLSSVDWLLTKNRFINRYLELGTLIECSICSGTSHLQVHHLDYQGIGSEDFNTYDILSLCFLCNKCHESVHK